MRHVSTDNVKSLSLIRPNSPCGVCVCVWTVSAHLHHLCSVEPGLCSVLRASDGNVIQTYFQIKLHSTCVNVMCVCMHSLLRLMPEFHTVANFSLPYRLCPCF